MSQKDPAGEPPAGLSIPIPGRSAADRQVEVTPSSVPATAHAAAPPHLSVHTIQIKFLEQLKRRNVGRVVLLYLGICWVILDPIHVVFHMVGVPEWASRLVIVVMALGFPVAVVTAWIYEITPPAVKSGDQELVRRSLLRRTSRRLNRAIAAVATIMGLYFLLYHFWIGKHLTEPVLESADEKTVEEQSQPGAVVSLHSIAVLPFVDMSQSRDQQYLSDGLAEELLNLLAKLPELRVAARTSAFAFKDKAEDISTIAKKLRVAHVLEGSVRKSGNRVRITAQLIRADSGYHLWSETYDRNLDDIFKLQDEIAGAVVQALKVKLLGGSLPDRAAPKSPEAYNLYLQGRFFADLHTPEGFEKAVDYLQRASKLDATYEPTWTALSIVYDDVAGRGLMPAEQALPKAREAARVALELDPKSARAHVALGYLHMNDDWDWAAADSEFKQALVLEPGNASVLHAAASLDLVLGRSGASVKLFQETLARDPLRASSYSNLGVAYFASGRLTEAQHAFRRSLELQPAAGYTHNGLGLVLLSRGELDAALNEMRLETDEMWRLQGLALVYGALGRRTESDAVLAELTRKFQKESPYVIATVYGYRGDVDHAFEWLDRALTERDATLTTIKVDPLFKKIVDDPRYKELLAKARLPL